MNTLHHLFLAGDGKAPEKSDGLIWKTILREGEFALTPGLTGVKNKPFRVVANGDSVPEDGTISMSDIEESFQEKAFEHVTIPLSHKDELTENTGFIDQLRRKLVNGKQTLQAGMRFTEPEIKGKVERGTIPNCSSGIFFDFVRKADKKKFRAALKHAALTHSPWIPDMEPFGVIAASDENVSDEEIQVQSYEFAENEAGEVVWKEEESMSFLREKVQLSLGEIQKKARVLGSEVNYYVSDIATDKALVSEEQTGARWVVPFSLTEESDVTVSDPSRWIETRQIMVAAADDEKPTVDGTEVQEQEESKPEPQSEEVQELQFDDSPRGRLAKAQHERELRSAKPVKQEANNMADLNLADLSLSDEALAAIESALQEKDQKITNLSQENSELEKSDRERRVDSEIEKLKSIGLSEENGATGLLKFIRRAKISDNGQPAGILASDNENQEEESITLSDALDKVIELLPKNQEGRLELGEQHVEMEAGVRPPATTAEENSSHEDNLADAYAALGVERAGSTVGGE